MIKICNICGEQLEILVSDTSSCYFFCKKCGYNKEFSLKHSLLDSILKNLNNYLKTVDVHLIHNLNIEIALDNGLITVKINDIIIDKVNCNYSFTTKEIKHFRNSIIYIVEDSLSIDVDRINLNINF